MEGLENTDGRNIYESQENRHENPNKDLVKEYVFSEEKSISLPALAKAEGRSIVHGIRDVKNESALCNCKKGIEKNLLGKKPEELPLYWESVKNEYCDNYASSLVEGKKKDLPRSRLREKNKTILDEEKGNISTIARQKAEKSFVELEKGIMREITINRILNTIQDIKAEIANSELDIRNKIDIVAYPSKSGETDKIIIAVQVKGNHGKENGEVLEEVFSDTKDFKKKEFFSGCEEFKKFLNAKGSGVEVVRIWINISDSDITNEGAGFDDKLKVEIEYNLNEILKKYRN